jgi:tungstate transport system substrate-binding protein
MLKNTSCISRPSFLCGLLSVLLALAGQAACSRADRPVILATTSSVANSGLLDIVLAEYRGGTVRPVPVGSGRALDMLAAGSADVVISHAPAREAAALAAHPSWSYRKILYNDFLIVGPPEDPAAVAGATGAVEAMTRIARSTARFLSRGDESGTHQRERELWTAAGVEPETARLVVAGAGMGQTLRVAGSTGAYTLTDRGTYEALRDSVQLKVVFDGDPRLLNTYAVIADPSNQPGAEFARWLSEGAGRDVMAGALRAETVRGFALWPAGVRGSTPSSLPR